MREFLLAVVLSLSAAQSLAVPECPPTGGEEGDILLSNPADCTTYYMCLNGFPTLMPCSPGLHWNDATKRCDYPEIAQCEESEEKPTTAVPTTSSPTSAGPTTTRRPVPDKCPAENGPEDVLLPNPADCGSFFKCLDGVPHLIHCPAGQHWSIDLNRCDYPEIAKCVETETSHSAEITTATPPTVGPTTTTRGPRPDKCPAENGPEDVLLPNPADCGSFFKCLNGVPHLIHCPAGQHWSIDLNRCDYPEIAKCVETETSHTAETTSAASPTTGPSTTRGPLPDGCPAENGPEDVLLPNPEDCGSFFLCLNGKPILMQCPPGQHWSVELNRCDYPEAAKCEQKGFMKLIYEDSDCPVHNDGFDILLPNPEDCSTYFHCSNGVKILMKCGEGTLWDAIMNRCDHAHLATCAS